MVADSEMKRYYREHQDRFAYPEEYQLSQIPIKPRTPDGLPAARGGRSAVGDLETGGALRDLAMRFSDGADASRGGRLGLVRQGTDSGAGTGAHPLPVGQITGIVETAEGLHIVRGRQETAPVSGPSRNR